MRPTTEIKITEHGDETHESWVLIRANRVQSNGTRLFGSEINHNHFIHVAVSRCVRKRSLKHDSLFDTKLLLDVSMSEAQWGAFVSSFGHGSGVPATLTHLDGVGQIPSAPFESRLEESAREVREAGTEAIAVVKERFDDLEAAFERGAGKKELREKIRNLKSGVAHVPANMEFAATSLTEHAENVVTKARADIEAMVAHAGANQLEAPEALLLGAGKEPTDG